MAPRRPSGRDKNEMARERQQRYLKRALEDPDGLLLTRLQVMLGANAAATLERIVAATGRTKREIIEEAILELGRKLEINETSTTGEP